MGAINATKTLLRGIHFCKCVFIDRDINVKDEGNNETRALSQWRYYYTIIPLSYTHNHFSLQFSAFRSVWLHYIKTSFVSACISLIIFTLATFKTSYHNFTISPDHPVLVKYQESLNPRPLSWETDDLTTPPPLPLRAHIKYF